MWVSTSFSSALNFLPHQVRSAFDLSIRPPSRRTTRKSPCSAHGGTSSGLARYSLCAGYKECIGGHSDRLTSSSHLRNSSSPSKLVRTSACEFAQQKLLGQTEGNME